MRIRYARIIYYILYFTGFAFIPTERPIAFVMNAQGDKAIFVPRLEVKHAKSKTGYERADHYVEYSFDPHPAQVLKKTLGDHTEIKPGMVFTVEPGLYAANLGGFRHSDTVVVTQDGIEILTYHLRDLDSLIIPA